MRTPKIGLVCLGLLTACASAPTDSGGEAEQARHSGFDQAVAALRAGEYADAAARLEPLAERYPRRAGVWVNLALAYEGLDREQDSLVALERAREADPEHAQANNLYAIAQRRAGHFDKARETYEQLLAAEPEYLNGHLNLAILCDMYLGDYQCAKTHYRRYQSLSTEEGVPADEAEQVEAWVADLQRRMKRDSG